MYRLASCATLAILLAAAGPLTADEKKEKGPPCKVDRLNIVWSLKVTAVVAKDGTDSFGQPSKAIRLTLEFTNDEGDVKGLIAALAADDGDTAQKGQPYVLCYFFDEENVVLGKLRVASTEGEITGKRGDAFRVTAFCPVATYPKVKTIELRPPEREKAKSPNDPRG